jgi:hypothetical protein
MASMSSRVHVLNKSGTLHSFDAWIVANSDSVPPVFSALGL